MVSLALGLETGAVVRTRFHIAASPSLHAEYWKSGLKTQGYPRVITVWSIGSYQVVRVQLQQQYLR